MGENIITSTIDLLKLIRSSKVAQIHFIKQDKTSRLMKCTLDFSLIPKKETPKNLDISNILSLIQKNVIHVFDTEKKGWRSIRSDKTRKVEIDGKVYQVKIKEEK